MSDMGRAGKKRNQTVNLECGGCQLIWVKDMKVRQRRERRGRTWKRKTD